MAQLMYDAMKPFYVWPEPFCSSALDFIQYLDIKRRTPGIVTCFHFLQGHPELIVPR